MVEFNQKWSNLMNSIIFLMFLSEKEIFGILFNWFQTCRLKLGTFKLTSSRQFGFQRQIWIKKIHYKTLWIQFRLKFYLGSIQSPKHIKNLVGAMSLCLRSVYRFASGTEISRLVCTFFIFYCFIIRFYLHLNWFSWY